MPNPTTELSLDEAKTIIAKAFEKAAELGLKPLAVTVLDAGGHIKAVERQDGASFHRPEIGLGKAYGALTLGLGSRSIFNRAEQQAYFVTAVNGLVGGKLVPVPGGVLVRDGGGADHRRGWDFRRYFRQRRGGGGRRDRGGRAGRRRGIAGRWRCSPRS